MTSKRNSKSRKSAKSSANAKMKSLRLRFGVPTLDQLLGVPRSEPHKEPDSHAPGIGLHSPTKKGSRQDAISVCLIGIDGVGKSILAMHMASRYRADVNECIGNTGFNPAVLYASTDLTYGRADVSWRSFGLNYPGHRIDDPFDIQHVLDRFSTPLNKDDQISLEASEPLDDPLRDHTRRDSVKFIDLAAYTTGDDWGYINRLVGALPDPDDEDAKHLLVVDAVEGLEVLVGDIDAYGQRRDRRSRVAQLIRTAANKCHLVFLVEANEEGKKTPEEFIADAVVRLGSKRHEHNMERFVQVDKVRAQAPVTGSHTILFRPGRGSTTGRMINPDDPPVILPECRGASPKHKKKAKSALGPFPYKGERQTGHDDPLSHQSEFDAEQAKRAHGWQAYVYVLHSLNLINRQVMIEPGSRIETRNAPLAGFGIENLDNLLCTQNADANAKGNQHANGDALGLTASDPVALIGEDGTYKSKLSKAFLAQAKTENDDDRAEVAVLITTKTLEGSGLRERLEEHRGTKAKKFHHVFCRRLEVHSQSAESLFHVILQVVRRAQAAIFLQLSEAGRPSSKRSWMNQEGDRRQQGWRIRLVIDNWTSIRDMYPRVRENPLFLPTLMFFLRREGIATLVVANEDRGFSDRLVLKSTRRLRDLTATQIFTWRVPYFGENRVAITVMPPQKSNGQGSVIRELKVLRKVVPIKPVKREDGMIQKYARPDHAKKSHSWKVAVDRSFELYEGLERGEPRYVPMRVHLYAGSGSARRYFDDFRHLLDSITSSEADGSHVLEEIEPEHYDRLREFCELQGTARYPYTLVLQVDEYWSRSQSLQLHSQEEYLRAVTSEIEFERKAKEVVLKRVFDYITDDPFRLFQPTATEVEKKRLSIRGNHPLSEKLERHSFFANDAYSLETMLEDKSRKVQKVPYAWDFGFLMINRCAWQESESSGKVHKATKWGQFCTVDSPSTAKHLTWHKFAKSCVKISRYQNSIGSSDLHYVPFSVSPELQETVSCLFLEIWVSEIETTRSDVDLVFPPTRERVSGWDIGQLLKEYTNEACKALLIMSALLPPEVMTDGNAAIPPNDGNNIPVAIRAWFSAAEAAQEPVRVSDIYVPARLPGTRSVRGDWFLSTARGSRSYQMGERAIDLLCSRRGNILRLQNGVGLPVRDVGKDQQELWTPLWHHDTRSKRRSRKVQIDELRTLGADGDAKFNWLWRSRIVQYDRHARVLRRFICSTLRQRDQLLNGSEALNVYHHVGSDEFKAYKKRVRGFLNVLERATIFESRTPDE